MKRSRILDEVHESAKGSYRSGAIGRKTMREFAALTRQETPAARRRAFKRFDVVQYLDHRETIVEYLRTALRERNEQLLRRAASNVISALEWKSGPRERVDAAYIDVNSNNVFADLDLPDAWTLGAKCRLSAWARVQVTRKRWSRRVAMKRLGATSKEVADLLGNNFEKVTLDQAVNYLQRLGQRVELVLFNDAKGNRKWRDPNDAPAITQKWVDSAKFYRGEKLIRGRRSRRPSRMGSVVARRPTPKVT